MQNFHKIPWFLISITFLFLISSLRQLLKYSTAWVTLQYHKRTHIYGIRFRSQTHMRKISICPMLVTKLLNCCYWSIDVWHGYNSIFSTINSHKILQYNHDFRLCRKKLSFSQVLCCDDSYHCI